jgi:hypothetical protein
MMNITSIPLGPTVYWDRFRNRDRVSEAVGLAWPN